MAEPRREVRSEPMTRGEYQKVVGDMHDMSSDPITLETYRRARAYDDNFVWYLPGGVMANLLEEALEEIDRLKQEIGDIERDEMGGCSWYDD